jgi:hypothetical protein
MRGGGGGIAGSQPMNTAVHITWHGTQINFEDLPLYLTYGALTFSVLLYITDKLGQWLDSGHLPVGEDIEEIVEVTIEEHALCDARLVEEAVAGERVLEHVDLSRPPEGPRELSLQFPDVN